MLLHDRNVVGHTMHLPKSCHCYEQDKRGSESHDLSCGLEPLPIHIVHGSMTHMYPKEFFYIVRSQVVSSKIDLHDIMIKSDIGLSDMCSNCDDRDCLDYLCPCALSTGGHYYFNKTECLNEAWSKSQYGALSTFIIECNDRCGCSRSCENRVVQRGMKYKLEII